MERDAAVLQVTLIELSLDLRYIEKHPELVDVWAAHNNRCRKPWRVSKIMEDLYPDERERRSAEEVYTHCSMVKHANPAGGAFTMPIGVENRRLVYRDSKNTALLPAYTFGAAAATYEALKAAARVLSGSGFDVEMQLNVADTAWRGIQNLLASQLVEMIARWPAE
jgi:hypothetical protein